MPSKTLFELVTELGRTYRDDFPTPGTYSKTLGTEDVPDRYFYIGRDPEDTVHLYDSTGTALIELGKSDAVSEFSMDEHGNVVKAHAAICFTSDSVYVEHMGSNWTDVNNLLISKTTNPVRILFKSEFESEYNKIKLPDEISFKVKYTTE
ncbi:hypothetical protein JXC34_05845 [Candidatus Woesearchaeota archaeon]|nr:hypothetical protein [Candidatus Woesearchaeota archaeon]